MRKLGNTQGQPILDFSLSCECSLSQYVSKPISEIPGIRSTWTSAFDTYVTHYRFLREYYSEQSSRSLIARFWNGFGSNLRIDELALALAFLCLGRFREGQLRAEKGKSANEVSTMDVPDDLAFFHWSMTTLQEMLRPSVVSLRK
jgi:hypothetical protein